MPLMQPPAGWRNVIRGGHRVPAEGLEVAPEELPELVAQGWSEVVAPAKETTVEAAAAAEGEVVR